MKTCCTTLSDLPSPPPGKTGWPWTEASPILPDTMPDGRPWPRISIVTPSYNQGNFLEETIRSVLLQGYPNLEYMVIDGGSTDNSVEIIRKYEPYLTFWVSELDRGQASAINKGWKKATGEVLAWLNSDDIYLAGVLGDVAIESCQLSHSAVLFGDCYPTDANSQVLGVWKGRMGSWIDSLQFWSTCHPTRGKYYIPQPSTFIPRGLINRVGMLDESLYYPMDYDLWLRIRQKYSLYYLPKVLATSRIHPATKSATWSSIVDDGVKVSRRYWGPVWSPIFLLCWSSLVSWRARQKSQMSFKSALDCWANGDRRSSMKFLLKSVLQYPPNSITLGYITLFFRDLLGDGMYETQKRLFLRLVSH